MWVTSMSLQNWLKNGWVHEHRSSKEEINEKHLRRILADYLGYYHTSRPHLSLSRNSRVPREIEPPPGQIIAIPQVGGLHHRYARCA